MVLEKNQWLDCSVRSSGWAKHSLLYILPQESCKKPYEENMCMKYLHRNKCRNMHVHNIHFTLVSLVFIVVADKAALVHCELSCDWFKSCHVFKPTWPPSPLHTYTATRTHVRNTHLSPAFRLHHTSDLRESHPKSFLWIIEEDHASLTLIILQSIFLASPPITSNVSHDRSSQSEEPLQLEMHSVFVLHCLHRHRLASIIGVFMLVTDMITDWQLCSCVF